MTQRRHIVTAALVLFLGNLVSRALGLVREQVIASLFSISVVTSAFQTANTVPTMFYDLLIGGAVSAALIPVLSGYADAEDHSELGRIVGTLLTGAALLLTVLIVFLVAIAGPLASVLETTTNPEAVPLTVGFLQIVIPSLAFLGMSGVTTAVCYARRWVALPAFSIALYNGGMVLTIALLHHGLGPSSMAAGVLVGAFLQFVAVTPGLAGIPIKLGLDLKHPAIRRILRLYAPVAAGLIITEVGVLVDRKLAWSTGTDSVAIMRYATFLVQLPLGLVATATSLAVLPILSRLIDDAPGFRHTLSLGLRLALLAIIPAGAFLITFREPIIRLLFQHGAFDASATSVTATAFLLYAPQLPFVAIDQLLVYAFYARKNTLTPMLVGLGGVCVYLVTALVLIYPAHLGLAGLILANTLQNSLHAVVLLALLWRSIGSLKGLGVGKTTVQALGAGALAAIVALLLVRMVPAPVGLVGLTLYVASGVVATAVTYLGVLYALGVEEIQAVSRLLRRRLVPVTGG